MALTFGAEVKPLELTLLGRKMEVVTKVPSFLPPISSMHTWST